jgi:hypothetical protein
MTACAMPPQSHQAHCQAADNLSQWPKKENEGAWHLKKAGGTPVPPAVAALWEDRMAKQFKWRVIWPIFAVVLTASLLACASRPQLRPKVQAYPSQFPYSVNFKGLAIAVVPFDGVRDVYSDPADPSPRKPDFDWLKAGVRPIRIILANEGSQPVLVDPSQITCIDTRGVTYKAYGPREAGDAVVASEAFRTHLRRGLAGALVGGALGAGMGAALGAATSYGGYAATGAAVGAAWGGAWGGTQGLFVGVAKSRAELERRVRGLLDSQQLKRIVLAPGMTGDGLVFFPAVPVAAVRLVLATPDRQASWTVEVEISPSATLAPVFPPNPHP